MNTQDTLDLVSATLRMMNDFHFALTWLVRGSMVALGSYALLNLAKFYRELKREK